MKTRKEYEAFMAKTSRDTLAEWAKEHPGEQVFKHYTSHKVKEYIKKFEKEKECVCLYRLTMSGRSDGKTYDSLADALFEFFSYGWQFAYVRRHDVDFKSKRGASLFEGHVANGLVSFLSEGEWSGVYYYAGRWFLSRIEVDGRGHETVVKSETPIGYAFALNTSSHDKSNSFPGIHTIIFDEFVEPSSGYGYLFSEFTTLMNLISTIVRLRTDVKVIMLANTVNRTGCPYFTEMGLKKVKQMKPGEIQGYVYDTGGKKKLGLVVEYLDPQAKAKPSNIYFAFENSRLDMITRGGWEIPSVPHIPISLRPHLEKFRAYIRYDDETLCMKVIQGRYTAYDEEGRPSEHYADFLAVVPHTREIKDEDNQLVYDLTPDPRPTHRTSIKKPAFDVELKLALYIRQGKIFFSDNDTGSTFYNYLRDCK